MAQLAEIDGPPCHLRALLKCLASASATLTLKMDYDRAMTYPQYVRAILCSVSLCRSQVCVEIHLPSCYDLVLDQRTMESFSTITLPEVVSLEITFPSMSERRLLVCFHAYVPYGNKANLVIFRRAVHSGSPLCQCCTIYQFLWVRSVAEITRRAQM